MIDRPILFSAPMIRAIIREIENPGTGKTETRRILKPQPEIDRMGNLIVGEWNYGQTISGEPNFRNPAFIKALRLKSRGVRLWVREAWKPHSIYDRMPPREMPPSKIFYLADDGYSPSGSRGRPGIHMPRWASRITLIVEDVKVERLQEISDAAAQREGIRLMTTDRDGMQHFGFAGDDGVHPRRAAWAFERLWTSINGPESWRSNPWVAAIRFRPYLCNIDQMKDAA